MDNRYDFLGDQYAGCTANVCFVTDKEIYVANAGDSRCVACCGGKAVPLSFDHKPDHISELTRIKEAGGFVANGRINQALNISRSLGDL
jgi:serine/threonine protein phosphatase PrpC